MHDATESRKEPGEVTKAEDDPGGPEEGVTMQEETEIREGPEHAEKAEATNFSQSQPHKHPLGELEELAEDDPDEPEEGVTMHDKTESKKVS